MSHCQEPGEVEQVRLTCPQVCGIKTQVPWEADSENEIDMQDVYQEGLLGSTPREGVWEWGRGKKLPVPHKASPLQEALEDEEISKNCLKLA